MVELRSTNLHWLYDENPFEDLSAHGGVYLNINGLVVSDGKDSDWAVSTASYYLLETIWSDRILGSDERHLIPHCGHCMFKADDQEDGLYISECSSGIDWEIRYRDETVIHQLSDGTILETSRDEWREAICRFSKEVLDFFMKASPKLCEDEYEREGFETFMRSWLSRLDRACNY